MMAYAHVYECERLLLICPHHGGMGTDEAGLACLHKINGTTDRRIGVATLSLSNPKAAVKHLRDLLSKEELAPAKLDAKEGAHTQ